MGEDIRVGEVVESCTKDFIAQCYELYQSPPLGSLVKTGGGSACQCLYGIVYNALTIGVEPGRRPIARGKDELNEDEIYRSSPQLMKLLKSEFNALVIGHKKEEKIFQHLPPGPARLHGFVYLCSPAEVKLFSHSFNFFNILLNARLEIPAEELITAALREMSRAYGAERHAFLVSAGKELASLLSADYVRLKVILKGLKYDATGT